MKTVIQQTSDLKNYIVITDNSQEFIVKNINEAIELKDKLNAEKKKKKKMQIL